MEEESTCDWGLLFYSTYIINYSQIRLFIWTYASHFLLFYWFINHENMFGATTVKQTKPFYALILFFLKTLQKEFPTQEETTYKKEKQLHLLKHVCYLYFEVRHLKL